MNKETRTFISGLFLSIIGGIAVSHHVSALVNGVFETENIFQWTLLILSSICFIVGMLKVINTTN